MRPPFQHVQQRAGDDCGVAALAMFLGIDYDQAVAAVRAVHPAYELGGVLSLGMLLAAATEHADELIVMTHHRDARRPAILCVQAPHDERLGHAVYWDGAEVWDPTTGGAVVDGDWVDGHCYAQIQRVSDLVELVGRSTAAEIRARSQVREGEFLDPGMRR